MSKPFLIGLTGSIGMGKSTTAGLFADCGVPVWDADQAVHRLYSADGDGVAAVKALCPACVSGGYVDRACLKTWIGEDSANLARLEAVIHPLVAQDRNHFIAECSTEIAVLDIPLLFETGMDAQMDAVVVVSTTETKQKERVMARSGMTEALFHQILERQTPDKEKRARADFVIETNTLEAARRQVRDVLQKIRSQIHA